MKGAQGVADLPHEGPRNWLVLVSGDAILYAFIDGRFIVPAYGKFDVWGDMVLAVERDEGVRIHHVTSALRTERRARRQGKNAGMGVRK